MVTVTLHLPREPGVSRPAMWARGRSHFQVAAQQARAQVQRAELHQPRVVSARSIVVQAAVLRVKLKHLDAWTASRQANAAFYDTEFASAKLEGKLITPYAVPGCRHIYNQYVIRAANRDGLRAHLGACGIGTEIYYPVSLHQQTCFEYLGYKTGDFPESERAAAETVALPIYPELTNDQLAHVVASIAEFYT